MRAPLSSLIAGSQTVIFMRPLGGMKYIKSWFIAGQHFVHDAMWPKPLIGTRSERKAASTEVQAALTRALKLRHSGHSEGT
jgi:hypothetical protein